VNSQNKISIQETGGVAQVVEHLLSKLRGTLHQKKKKNKNPNPVPPKREAKKRLALRKSLNG
jgi:peptide deformylase